MKAAGERSWAAGRTIAQGLGLTWFVAGIVVLSFARRINAFAAGPSLAHASILPVVVTGGVAALLAGLFMAGFLAHRKAHLAIPLCLLCVAGLVELVSVAVLPTLDPSYSARAYAELLRQDLRPERIFTYELPRSWSYGLAFYFGRELPEWSPADPEPALAITTAAGFAQIRTLGRFHGELDEGAGAGSGGGGGVRLTPIEAAPH
jgi:hypothetical protein